MHSPWTPARPGTGELLLYPDGRLETTVHRLADYPDPLKLQTDGY